MKNFKFLILMLLTLVNIQSIYSQISVPYGDDAIGDNNNLGRESNEEPLVILSEKEIEIRLAQSKEINIFPNPFNDFINIDISKSKEEITSIDVFSSDGKLLEHLDKSRISPINMLKPSIESGLVIIIVSFKSGNKIFKSIKI